MLKITRLGKSILLTTETGLCENIVTQYSCENELYAQLLQRQLSKHLGEFMAEVRANAYNQGWKDKASKKVKKKTTHSEQAITAYWGY